jgi:NADH-quinone oxidoreductase subunit M
MNSIELIMLIVVAGALLSYIIGRFHAKAGSILVLFTSVFAFLVVGYYGYVDGSLSDEVLYLSFLEFSVTELGIFFATIVTFVFAMVSFFNPFFIDTYKYKGAYSLLYLLTLAGTIGVFFTSSLLYLFFFFELVVWASLFLIPMGSSKKATAWYFGFSALGSFSFLFAVLLIEYVTGSYNVIAVETMSGGYTVTVFILLAIAAFSKLGAFPFHIWLPLAHGNAPHTFSPVLSGALVKLGAFVGVMALVKLSGVGAFISLNGYINMSLGNYIVSLLGALTIVFGTLMAIRQDDAKKLLAYSSMSHGGYILVAFAMMNSQAIAGGLFHILSHALASTAAFLSISVVAYFTNTKKISELGGMIHKMPITYMVYLIAIISMAGIPPMGGFISKWMIFQSVIDNGLIFVGIATFIGSVGSFLYVFRPLAAVFLGQELNQHEGKVKEAPFFMLVPMLIISLLNVVTGVVPNFFLEKINLIVAELGLDPVTLSGLVIEGPNGKLNPTLVSGVFAVGIFIAFVIFILLKKSKKVDLMDTYTAGNFVYNQDLLHYSVDFYAPLERLYEKYINIMRDLYHSIANKVKEFGRVMKYFFFANKPEITVFFIMIVIIALLWGEIL